MNYEMWRGWVCLLCGAYLYLTFLAFFVSKHELEVWERVVLFLAGFLATYALITMSIIDDDSSLLPLVVGVAGSTLLNVVQRTKKGTP